MSIAAGEKLPEATLLRMGADGPEAVRTSELFGSGRHVLFGLPGAYTGTCTSAHVPSFMRVFEALRAKGVGRVACFSVNDPWVMAAWGESTGATAKGLDMLGDASAELTRGLGLAFSAPAVGFHDRCKRCSLLVEDGIVTRVNLESEAGTCTLTAGEALLDQL